MTTDATFEPTDSDATNGKGKPRYPNNSVKGTECGHYQEYDCTPGNERIRVQHRSGSFHEYQATGNVVHKIVGDGWHIVAHNQEIIIGQSGKGNIKITVMGDAEMHTTGNMHLLVDGDMDHTVKGDYNLTVQGDFKTNCEGAFNVTADDVEHESVNEITHSGNLNIRGDIICQQSVRALGNLTAGGHLSVQGSLMAEGLIPATGGEPLPHLISGICPGVGMIVSTVGAIEVASATAIVAEAGTMIAAAAGTTVDVVAGGAITVDAGAAVEIVAGGLCMIDATGAVDIASAAVVAIDAPIIELN